MADELTDDQISEFNEAFSLFDKDGDGGESSMRYRAGDVAKQMDLDPLLSGAEPSPSQPILLLTGAPHDNHTSSRLRKSYELVQAAEKSLEGPNYSYGFFLPTAPV